MSLLCRPFPQLTSTDCVLGSLRRIVQGVELDNTDSLLYCGTQTGDFLEVNARNGRFIRAGPNRFSQGITVVKSVPGRRGDDAVIIIGNGDGSVAVLDAKSLRVLRYVKEVSRVGCVRPCPSCVEPPDLPLGFAVVHLC